MLSSIFYWYLLLIPFPQDKSLKVSARPLQPYEQLEFTAPHEVRVSSQEDIELIEQDARAYVSLVDREARGEGEEEEAGGLLDRNVEYEEAGRPHSA